MSLETQGQAVNTDQKNQGTFQHFCLSWPVWLLQGKGNEIVSVVLKETVSPICHFHMVVTPVGGVELSEFEARRPRVFVLRGEKGFPRESLSRSFLCQRGTGPLERGASRFFRQSFTPVSKSN
ncbi:hypothetical protein P5673_001556 [Acropora cervicornis]|uniref:Uncharacterized protein n=1 Tax=Acropora cervicornis TaxID=6130 RepID=A0AAD9R6L9_ACRCE|nr:hypothetical protein P5673_001556 [Acropora cervicornis]